MNSGHSRSDLSPFKPWVWGAFALLFLGALPVWPIHGSLFGLPLWALMAVAMSAVLSLFTAWVALNLWKDPEEPSPQNDNHDAD